MKLFLNALLSTQPALAYLNEGNNDRPMADYTQAIAKYTAAYANLALAYLANDDND